MHTQLTHTTEPLPRFDFRTTPFGKQSTDHMLLASYADGAWQEARIEPFHALPLSPLAMCLHYGQTVFEGLKAYRQPSGTVSIFRLDKHFSRINQSLKRMAMPELPEHLFVDGIKQLVAVEQEWVPAEEGCSLYIRPLVIATEERLGVAISKEYLFMVICSPMAAYYPKPLKVKVEKEFTRAAPGGVGEAKNGGNYGAAFYPTRLANEQGFDQVLWTDACGHEYLEESGTMNLMFIINNCLITPPVGGTILDGVTRDSILTLARQMGMAVEERPIRVGELAEAFRQGASVEAFGAGTAAAIAPFELIHIDGTDYYPYRQPDALMFTLRKELQAIRYGEVPDPFGWNWIVQTSI